MNMKSGARDVLCLSGFPNPSQWGHGVLEEEVRLLDGEWALRLDATTTTTTTSTPDYAAWPRWGMEHLFRTMDRRLFGRHLRRAADLDLLPRLDAASVGPGNLHLAYSAATAEQEAARRQESVLYVEFEDRPMADLEEAVRSRLGVPDATLNAKVWMASAQAPKRLLFEGELDLDHRALCTSVAMCAAKLPTLLHAALARIDQAEYVPATARKRAQGQALSARRLLLRVGHAVVQRLLWRQQWQIESYQRNGQGDARGKISTLFKPPAGAFWADPFLLNQNGRTWLMFEELPYKTNKGHISAIELDVDGKPLSQARVVLDEPWHLAYPFVFKEGGKTYMMPDASKSGELALYECGDDGWHWTRVATLMRGLRMADSTIIAYMGKLWMFTTQAERDASLDDTLYIYWADDLMGPWHPHALNPVKIDAGSSRPAGSMWLRDGVLHRVVQNCASTYGGATVCLRVNKLSETEFQEEIVTGWGGGEQASRVPWHTYNRHANVFVLDRLRRCSRWLS